MANSDLHQQTLKQLLKKFSSSELFALKEAAHYLKVSEKYLFTAIKAGRVKAFKVDDHWFIEEKWLMDFKKSIHQHLKQEVDGHQLLKQKNKQWVRPVQRRARASWRAGTSAWLPKAALLAVVSVGFFCLTFPLSELNSRKYHWAAAFLNGVNDVYSAPLNVFSWRPAYGAINDEALTEKINSLINDYRRRGKVAGVSEKKEIKRSGWRAINPAND